MQVKTVLKSHYINRQGGRLIYFKLTFRQKYASHLLIKTIKLDIPSKSHTLILMFFKDKFRIPMYLFGDRKNCLKFFLLLFYSAQLVRVAILVSKMESQVKRRMDVSLNAVCNYDFNQLFVSLIGVRLKFIAFRNICGQFLKTFRHHVNNHRNYFIGSNCFFVLSLIE